MLAKNISTFLPDIDFFFFPHSLFFSLRDSSGSSVVLGSCADYLLFWLCGTCGPTAPTAQWDDSNSLEALVCLGAEVWRTPLTRTGMGG